MAGITLGAKALVDFGKAAIKTSSDLEEIQNVTDTVFGSMAKDVDNFSKTLIESHGIGELSAKKYASYMGAMLKSSGIQGDAVRQMSKDLTLLTADMASFYNLGTEEMFQKLMSGMSGATMPLKQLGINMNIANLQAFALSQGIEKSWKNMSQAEQVMLRYQYLMSVTGDAQGDFARNSWNWAHSLKILSEKWQEFLGIVGKGLQAIVLPLVKALIKVLDLLIKIATAVEKVFVMITGKKVDVEPRQVGIVDDYADAIGDLGDFADDAAKNQKKLGKGIKDAAKAAKGALAPFDELNILQQNLAGGGSGAGDGQGSPLDGLNFNNDFKMDPVGDSLADGFKLAKDEGDRFFIWFTDKWNRLREMLSIPLMVAEPVFPTLPVPVYEPEWGLDMPHIPSPIFPPIPSPVYRPNWGLDTPKVPAPVFPKIPVPVYEPVWNLIPPPVPAVDDVGYVKSLEEMKVKTSKVYENIKTETEALRKRKAELWGGMRKDTEEETGKINTGLAGAWAVREKNYETHKGNLGVISAAIAAVTVANLNSGLMTSGRNTNTALGGMQSSWNIFGKNTGLIAAATGLAIAANLGEGLKVSNTNFGSFYNSTLPAMKSWGVGMLKISAEVGKGILDNIVNSLSTAFRNIIDFAKATGEKVSGWFSANKSVITKVAIGAGIAVGVGALALAAPAAIPFVTGGLAGLASIPALAKGGITDGPMLAMIGDNPGGKEVVSPLDDLTDIIASAVGTAVVNAMQFNSSGSNNDDTELTIELDGTKLGRVILPKLNEEADRLGYKPILQTE